MAGRFSIEAVFRAVDKVTAPVTRMQNRVGKFTRTATRGFQRLDRVVGRFTSGLKRGAVSLVAAAALVGVVATSVLGAGADFEQAITNVGAVSLKTRAEIEALEKQALQLGRVTKFTATQSASAMEVLARAGFDTQQILKATPAILSAAAASGLEIAEVANHVSNVLKGMGLETSEAARVADVLALASSRTNSSIGSLGESMKNVATTAKQLKIPLEDTVAAVALMQDVGLDASVAGSAFNTMLTKMAAPTDTMRKKMRRFGVSFKDAKGDMLPFQKVIEQLNKATKKAGGNFDKVAFLAELVGLRGQKAASNLATLFETGKLTELTEGLKNAAGAAGKMAAIRMDTVRGRLLLLTSAIDAVKLSIFSLNQGPLAEAIEKTTAWVSANEKLISSRVGAFLAGIIENFKDIVKWGKRIAIAVGVFAALVLILKTFILVMTAVNLVMALNPVGLIVLGIAALIAGIILLVKWVDKIWEGFDKLPFVVKLLLAPLGLIIKAVKFIVDNLDNIIGAAKSVADFFSFSGVGDGPGAERGAASMQVISPQARTSKHLEEIRSKQTSELIIKDETGRAEAGRALVPGMRLQQTGAF